MTDPRIARRRQEVARARGRKRLRVLVTLACVIAVVVAIGGLLQSPLLDVDRVEVSGARETTLASVLHTTGLDERGHAMITVDRFALAHKVERLPWVLSAEVTRKWPNVVRVRITERTAIGAIAVPGGVALLDGGGRVLATAATQPPGTVTVQAAGRVPRPGGTVSANVRTALGILHGLSQALASQVQVVHQLDGEPAAYELGVAPGVVIRLGEPTDIRAKLSAAEAVYAQQHAAGTVIDVRVPAAPTVTHAP